MLIANAPVELVVEVKNLPLEKFTLELSFNRVNHNLSETNRTTKGSLRR